MGIMSTITSPKRDDYKNGDNFKLAKDLAWLAKTVWGAAVVSILAGMWVATLASNVSSNSKAIDARKEAVDAIPAITEALARIEKTLAGADERQRKMKSQLDKLEARVDEQDK